MGIRDEYLMEHVVYTVGGTMGLVLTWHHEFFQKTPEEMGNVLYQMMHH